MFSSGRMYASQLVSQPVSRSSPKGSLFFLFPRLRSNWFSFQCKKLRQYLPEVLEVLYSFKLNHVHVSKYSLSVSRNLEHVAQSFQLRIRPRRKMLRLRLEAFVPLVCPISRGCGDTEIILSTLDNACPTSRVELVSVSVSISSRTLHVASTTQSSQSSQSPQPRHQARHLTTTVLITTQLRRRKWRTRPRTV